MWQILLVVLLIVCLVAGWIYYTYFYNSDSGDKKKGGKKSGAASGKRGGDRTSKSNNKPDDVDETVDGTEQENTPAQQESNKKDIQQIYAKVHKLFCEDQISVGQFVNILPSCNEADFLNLKALYDTKPYMGAEKASVTMGDYAQALG